MKKNLIYLILSILVVLPTFSYANTLSPVQMYSDTDFRGARFESEKLKKGDLVEYESVEKVLSPLDEKIFKVEQNGNRLRIRVIEDFDVPHSVVIQHSTQVIILTMVKTDEQEKIVDKMVRMAAFSPNQIIFLQELQKQYRPKGINQIYKTPVDELILEVYNSLYPDKLEQIPVWNSEYIVGVPIPPEPKVEKPEPFPQGIPIVADEDDGWKPVFEEDNKYIAPEEFYVEVFSDKELKKEINKRKLAIKGPGVGVYNGIITYVYDGNGKRISTSSLKQDPSRIRNVTSYVTAYGEVDNSNINFALIFMSVILLLAIPATIIFNRKIRLEIIEETQSKEILLRQL